MPTIVASAGDVAIERWGAYARADAYRLLRCGDQLRWSAIGRALREDPNVRLTLVEALRGCSHDAYFWECGPWPAERDPYFEFVLVDAPAFAPMTADPAAFGDHFTGGLVAGFDNLGCDARLVSPAPEGRRDTHLHLAAFVRGAPEDQIDALWVTVGDEIRAWRRRRRGTLWLSTAGLGVPWVHVRLDERPKYYVHEEYRSA